MRGFPVSRPQPSLPRGSFPYGGVRVWGAYEVKRTRRTSMVDKVSMVSF